MLHCWDVCTGTTLRTPGGDIAGLSSESGSPASLSQPCAARANVYKNYQRRQFVPHCMDYAEEFERVAKDVAQKIKGP